MKTLPFQHLTSKRKQTVAVFLDISYNIINARLER